MTVMQWMKSLDVKDYLTVKKMIDRGDFRADKYASPTTMFVFGHWIPCTMKRCDDEIQNILDYSDWLESEVGE